MEQLEYEFSPPLPTPPPPSSPPFTLKKEFMLARESPWQEQAKAKKGQKSAIFSKQIFGIAPKTTYHYQRYSKFFFLC